MSSLPKDEAVSGQEYHPAQSKISFEATQAHHPQANDPTLEESQIGKVWYGNALSDISIARTGIAKSDMQGKRLRA